MKHENIRNNLLALMTIKVIDSFTRSYCSTNHTGIRLNSIDNSIESIEIMCNVSRSHRESHARTYRTCLSFAQDLPKIEEIAEHSA